MVAYHTIRLLHVICSFPREQYFVYFGWNLLFTKWHTSSVFDLNANYYRSPMADPKSKGVIYGLTLDTSEKHLALMYLATIQGIAYGTRHIVEHCNAHGHQVLIFSQRFNG